MRGEHRGVREGAAAASRREGVRARKGALPSICAAQLPPREGSCVYEATAFRARRRRRGRRASLPSLVTRLPPL